MAASSSSNVCKISEFAARSGALVNTRTNPSLIKNVVIRNYFLSFHLKYLLPVTISPFSMTLTDQTLCAGRKTVCWHSSGEFRFHMRTERSSPQLTKSVPPGIIHSLTKPCYSTIFKNFNIIYYP